LRTSLNGTFFTQDYFAKQKRETHSNCKHCGEPDSQLHRHWECKTFHKCREHLTEEQIQEIKGLDLAVCVHGWMPEPPSLRSFQKELSALDPNTVEHEPFQAGNEPIWMFTDGGCRAPTSPISKLASWGVAVGTLSNQNIQPLSCGVLSGIVQTAVRAEIVALISACEFAINTQNKVSFAIDNDLVFKRFVKFVAKDCHIKPNQKDADLWQPLMDIARRLRSQIEVIAKVVSHQDVSKLQTEEEIWCCKGNAAADALATHAVFNQPHIWTLWNKLQKEISIIHTLREAIHTTIVKVGKQAVREKPEILEEEDRAPHTARITKSDIVAVGSLPTISPLPLRYQIDAHGRILEWWNNIMDSTSEVQLVSWFQLNALYENSKLPVLSYSKSTKRWSTHNDTPKKGNFVTRTNSLSRFLQGMYAVAEMPCRVYHIRPNSECIQFWTQCLAVQIRGESWKLSEALLQEEQAVYKKVNALRSIDI